ncbi:MAG: tail fiber domain-containing protein [Saprospiraceae bacterium]|nr:tail fiber domain-containing protein [Saprospiraceae bacterium]
MQQRLTLLLLFVFCAIAPIAAQFVPQMFNYQSVIRDNNGNPITNQNVTLLFAIKSGAPNGPVAYSEKQSVTANEFGIINARIGNGTAVVGSFTNINWGGGSKYLTVSLESSPNVFDVLGSSELLSVPYALYAQNAANGGGTGGDNWGSQSASVDATLKGNGTPANPIGLAQQSAQAGQVLKWNGSAWVPSNDDTGTTTGTVTQINTGSGLTGGPITGTGTISLTNVLSNPGSYGSATQIPYFTVNAEGRITNVGTHFLSPVLPNIQGAAGINVQQNGSIYTITNTGDVNANDDLLTNTTFNGDVTGAYNALEIKPGVVGAAEIADGSVNTAELANGSVSTVKLADQAVTSAKLDDMGAANGQVLKWNGTSWAPAADNGGQTVSISGGTGITVNGTYPTFTIVNAGDTNATDDLTTTSTANGDVSGVFSNLQIKPDVITTSELANNAVESLNIANGAVSAAKLDDMGATTGQVLKYNGTAWAPAADQTGGTGGGNTIQAGNGINVSLNGTTYTVSNTGDLDGNDDVNTTTNANGDITGIFSNLQIKPGVVGNPEIAPAAVGTNNLINGAVTGPKINNMGAANGQVLKYVSGQWQPANDETGNGTGGDNWGTQVVVPDATLSGAGTNASPLKIAQQGATDGQFLRWNAASSTWLPATISATGGDNWGTQTAVTSTVLSGNGTAATPLTIAQQGAADGQVLKWDGVKWAPANDETGNGTGGDNWGTQVVVPDATLSGAGTNASPLKIAQQGATTGQVLRWDGSAWKPSTVTSTGDNWGTQVVSVSNVLTGNGLSSNPLNLAQQGATVGQVLRWNGTSWSPGAAAGDNWGTQTASTDATLTGNGTTANKLRLAQQGATTGQVLKWNGTAWAPGIDDVSTGGGGGTYQAGAGISITNIGATVFQVNNTGDLSNTNELQTLSLNNTTLSLSVNNSSVNLAPLLNSSSFWTATGANSPHIASTNDGNVIIGADLNTSGKLQVYNTNAEPAAFIDNTSGPALVTDNGNVGLHVSNPAYRLDVNGDAHIKTGGTLPQLTLESDASVSRMKMQSAGVGSYWGVASRNTNNGGEFVIEYGKNTTVDKMLTINDVGGVGIGGSTTTPGMHLFHDAKGFTMEHRGSGDNWELWVSNADGSLNLIANGNPAGSFSTTGAYTQISDQRLKKDIMDLPAQLMEKIMKLHPVTYRYTSENEDAPATMGFLAQEVKTLFPELVGQRFDRDKNENYLSLNYAGFGVLAVKAIQEQQSEIQTLKAEKDALLKKMQDFEKRLSELEKQK